jgi:hypothetical protein
LACPCSDTPGYRKNRCAQKGHYGGKYQAGMLRWIFHQGMF